MAHEVAVEWFGKVCRVELVTHTEAWFDSVLFQAGTNSEATKGIAVSQ